MTDTTDYAELKQLAAHLEAGSEGERAALWAVAEIDRLRASLKLFSSVNPSDVHLIDDSNEFWNRIEDFRSDQSTPLTLTEQRELAEWWAENMATIGDLDEANCRQGDENARLQAIVDKLPISGDGLSLIGYYQKPLFICGHNTGGEIERHDNWELVYSAHGDSWLVRGFDAAPEHNEHDPSECYSTRAAAEAAKDGVK